MTKLEKDLLAAILASPEEDDPRLVYADWLLEQTDDPLKAARGEFIQIQCTLGRPLVGAKGYVLRHHASAKAPKDPKSREELEKREKALLTKHQKEWIQEIRPFIRTWNWRRGFVEKVEADGAKFLSGAETIFANTPLWRAELSGMKKAHLELIPKTPALESLTELALTQQRIGPKNAHIFLTPYLSRLRRLDLYGNQLRDEGVATLASSKYLGNLRELDLSRCEMHSAGLEALSSAGFFTQLTSLNIDAAWDFSDPAKHAIRNAVDFLVKSQSLKTLSLERCHVGDSGIQQLASSAAFEHLEELNVRENVAGDAGAFALAKSTHLKSLKSVRGFIGYEQPITPGVRALQDRLGEENVS